MQCAQFHLYSLYIYLLHHFYGSKTIFNVYQATRAPTYLTILFLNICIFFDWPGPLSFRHHLLRLFATRAHTHTHTHNSPTRHPTSMSGDTPEWCSNSSSGWDTKTKTPMFLASLKIGRIRNYLPITYFFLFSFMGKGPELYPSSDLSSNHKAASTHIW